MDRSRSSQRSIHESRHSTQSHHLSSGRQSHREKVRSRSSQSSIHESRHSTHHPSSGRRSHREKDRSGSSQRSISRHSTHHPSSGRRSHSRGRDRERRHRDRHHHSSSRERKHRDRHRHSSRRRDDSRDRRFRRKSSRENRFAESVSEGMKKRQLSRDSDDEVMDVAKGDENKKFLVTKRRQKTQDKEQETPAKTKKEASKHSYKDLDRSNVKYYIYGSVQAGNLHAGSGDIHSGNSSEASPLKQRSPPTKQLEADFKMLGEKLNKVALEMAGERDFLDNKIRVVELQLTKQPSLNEEVKRSDEFVHRKEILKYFKEKPSGDVSYCDLFKEAKHFADYKCASYRTPEARESYIKSCENVILIAGQSGVGKSTLCNDLVSKMLDDKNRLFGCEIVFFLRLRSVDYEKKTNLLQFLTSGDSSILEGFKTENLEKFLDYLDKRENICLIFDGLDEAIISSNTNAVVPNCSINSIEKAETFIKNLICGKILRQCKKIVTSRPRQLANLPEECRQFFTVNILGVNDSDQFQICSDICCDASKTKEIIAFIDSRPDLKSYCSVPIIYILIVVTLNELDTKDWANSDSLSAILVTVLVEWFSKRLKGQFQIKEISYLAYKAFLKNRYFFDEWDLKEAKVNFDNLTTFLINKTSFQLLSGNGVISYFTHLILQEFFVAVWLRLFASCREFEDYLSKFSTDKYEVVTKFVFGLCNKATLRKLLIHVPHVEFNSKTDRKQSKEKLKQRTIGYVESQPFTDDDDDDYDDNELDNWALLLLVSRWCYEMRDDEFTKQLVTCFDNNFNYSNCTFSLSDIPGMNYVLQARETPLELKLDRPDFDGNCNVQFFDNLAKTMRLNSNIELQCLDLCWSTIILDDATLGVLAEHFISKTEDVELKLNVTKQGILAMADAVKKRTNPISFVHFYNMSVEDDAAKTFSECIDKIDKFKLEHCTITEQGFASLAAAISVMDKQIPSVWFSRMSVKDDAAKTFFKCIDEFTLFRCTISEQGFASLTAAISVMDRQMDQLSIHETAIHDVEAASLSQCVNKIRSLFIRDCGITSRGVAILAAQIENRVDRMESLFISRIDDDGVAEIMKCLKKLRRLHVSNSDVSVEMRAKLKEAADEVGTKLDLSLLR